MNSKKVNPNKFSNTEEAKNTFRLLNLIKHTDDIITKSREYELRKYGITPEQAATLICIQSLGNEATPAEIARWLFREANSISVLLNRMEKLGLIKKTAARENKHLKIIRLTDKGHKAYKHAIELYPFHDIIHALTKRRRQQLWSLLQMLRSRAFKHLGLDINQYSRLFSGDLALDLDLDDSNAKSSDKRRL